MTILMLVLSIINESMKAYNDVLASATPEQKQAIIDRHEKAMQFWFGWAEKLRGE